MENIHINDTYFKPFLSSKEIALTIKRMAAQISTDFRYSNPYFVAVLNGSFIFAADLVRYFDFACELGFVKLSSYENTQSSGKVAEHIWLRDDIKGRHVIILEDIVETGLTVATLRDKLLAMRPAGISLASLLVKPHLVRKDVVIDYRGFDIPDAFLVGYGLDFKGQGRNLSGIYQIVS